MSWLERALRKGERMAAREMEEGGKKGRKAHRQVGRTK